MKILLDINVILDAVMERPVFYRDSIDAIETTPPTERFVSAHTLTTVAYVMRKYPIEKRNGVLDFILQNCRIVPCDHALMAAARALDFTDFEDAVVAMAAKKAKCKYIVTRNQRDFANSPVPALTPGEFLAL